MLKERFMLEVEKFVKLLGPICSLRGRELDEFLREKEREYIEKKRQWILKNKGRSMKEDEPLMDYIKRVLYIENLEIPEDKMKEAEKTDNRLVIRFYNDCPILVACQRLDLDTRLICKEIFHKPYQALLSEINTRLKFERDYERIRPYCEYCLEMITLTKESSAKR